MEIRVRSITAVDERPGHAAVVIGGWGGGVTGLRYFVCRSHNQPEYLSPDGAPRERVWLTPDGVKQDGDAIELEIRASLVRKLWPRTVVQIGITVDPDQEIAVTHVLWPAIDTPDEWPSESPDGSEDVTRPWSPPPVRPRRRSWAVVAAALLVLGAAAIAVYRTRPNATPVVEPAAVSLPASGEELRARLRPLDGAAAFNLGRRLADAGRMDDALLANEHAAAQGDGAAAMAIARWYDPRTWTAEGSPFSSPNQGRALRWYEQAKAAGASSAAAEIAALQGLAQAAEGSGVPAAR